MATCNPQELLSANPCFSALSPYMAEVVETQMLCSLFNHLDSGTEFSCDVQTLLDDAACLYGLSSEQLRVIRMQMLCEIGALV